MKAMTMYRPITIQNALSDFDRYFESFFGDSVLPPSTRILNRLPAVDVKETENSYVLDMELPGYDEKDIEIHIDGASLSVASKQEEVSNQEADKDKGTWLLRERHVSSFSRSFKLPENANPEEVNAEFKNGILKMKIKKRAEAQKRAIRINVK
jgi:HSP20 family protein